MSCTMATSPLSVAALLQPCRVPRLCRLLPYGLYSHHVVHHGYVASVHRGSTSTMSCAIATSPPSAATLLQACCAPRLRCLRPQRLYFNHAVRTATSPPGASTYCPVGMALLRLCRASGRIISSFDSLSGCTGSTSITQCTMTTRLIVAPAHRQQCQFTIDDFG
jgi:hypothetical protein